MFYVIFPVMATIVGGAIAAFRPPGPQLGSAMQHFAAGVVFAAVAVELLPEVRAQHATLPVVVGFAAGVAAMLGVRALLERLSPGGHSSEAQPTGLIVVVGVDILLDGLLVGIGFAAGERTGLLLTFALTIELLFLGLATSAALHAGGAARARSVATTTALPLLVALGALIGLTLLRGLSGWGLAGVLSFGAAALLYLVTEELLVEAHEVPEMSPITAMFFAGFLAILIIEMAGVV